ncbi:YoaK family protein [Pseudomonas typographi]|uniref:DUF1275 domain-containing protein n=1 Tax=Pseudomonas typographi TaxID=2715964 RepID=A0ABR7YX68_9PSED|nr:YoaK family protein [Pseudomonas typographi]MBD1551181.1 DUF1275 domain-containing protein [Pseudomonas typographi]MBD1586325.1 DUF1275 domain-containing protein [Pseudomonas typographi]MBD1597797.1 DUF1275 domain-containing protein [Pseudomonas typographi]
MLPETTHLSQRAKRLERARGRVGLYFVAALSILAGMVDAIGFVAVGDFVSFMSGNTTRLALALGQGDGPGALRIGALIGTFIIGNAAGVLVGKASGKRAWPLLACIALLLGAAGGIATAWGLILAVMAMGMINTVVEHVNGLPIGLTYVTGALSRFGRGVGRWLAGERRSGWKVQLVPWAGMFAGAVLGVGLEHRFELRAMAIAGALTALLAVVTVTVPGRWLYQYRGP